MSSPLVDRCVAEALEHKNALLKRISPNDAGRTGSHQSGYYLPKNLWQMFTIHPPRRGSNTEHHVQVLWQDGRITQSCVKWYGAGTRSEYRLTRFGRDFPYLAADNVGDLLVLIRIARDDFHAYVFDCPDDVEDLQAILGVEVMGTAGIYPPTRQPETTVEECIERHFRRFASTLREFPTTVVFSQVTQESVQRCMARFRETLADDRLLTLVEHEYALFRMAERLLCQKEVCRPYRSVDDFMVAAARIMNRRKARAGRALENHVAYLLNDAGITFESQADVDGRPDILIPGKSAYDNPSWPRDKVFAVGLKTTCKDRWRQVLHEAKKAPHKHILTTQEGISANQLVEMREAHVSLVVPLKLHSRYPKVPGMPLTGVDEFITLVRGRMTPN